MQTAQLERLRNFYGRIRDDEDMRHSSMFRDGRTGNLMRYRGCEDAVEVLRAANADHPNNAYPYAILLLARHAIELRLKEAIQEARDHGHELAFNAKERKKLSEGTDPLWSTHDLKRLVVWMDSILAATGMGTDEGWGRTRSFLDEWQDADKDGLFLRYGRDFAGRPIDMKHNFSYLPVIEEAIYALQILEGVDSWMGTWETP